MQNFYEKSSKNVWKFGELCAIFAPAKRKKHGSKIYTKDEAALKRWQAESVENSLKRRMLKNFAKVLEKYLVVKNICSIFAVPFDH